MSKSLVLLAAGSLLYASLSFGEMYHWTDSNGVSHFTDEKPPASVANVETRALEAAPVVVTRSSGSFRYRESEPAGSRKAVSVNDSQTIQACERVKAELDQVQSRLRSGYREPRGNRLRAKRRALRDRYARECR